MSRRMLRLAGICSIAVAATVPLWFSPAYAACGENAVPAVFETEEHPAVWTTQPEVGHLEWQWTRQVETFEVEYSRVVSAAYNLIGWSRTIETIEYEYSRVVVDVPAIPAVPPTEEVGHWETVVVTPAVYRTLYEFQHSNGQTRWEPPEWSSEANPSSNGWVWTGQTQEELVTPEVTEEVWVVDVEATPGSPEVPAVTHVEWIWSTTNPGGDWVATGASRVADTETENVTLPEGETPDGTGWVEGGVVDTVEAVVETQWVPEAEPAPTGWTATGDRRVSGEVTETTPTTSAAAPGPGWSVVAGSVVEVVDQPAQEVLKTPGYTEIVLLKRQISGTSPCVAPAGTSRPAILPDTGNDFGWWMPAAGGLVLVAGVALTAPGRRRPT